MRAILTYHSIDDSGSPISLTRAVFERHVKWLRTGRVRVTSIRELLTLPDDDDAVALTFDDGFRNFATDAMPILEALPATLFVVIDHVGRTNAWRGRSTPGIPTLPLLGWSELSALQQKGVVLGAHTRTHADLSTLDAAVVEDELAGSAERLRQETGATPDGFAYPYGRISPTAVAAAGRTFQWACTTRLQSLRTAEALLTLPRLDMYYFQRPGLLESWGRPTFHAYVACRRLLRRGRQAATAAADLGTRLTAQ